MIIKHKAKRLDNNEIVEGFVIKIWDSYHIITEDDENTAYPVIEKSIEPILN